MAKEMSKTAERSPALRREWSDPFRSMIGLRDAINGMFEDFFTGRPAMGLASLGIEEKGFAPAVDIYDAGTELVVYAAIPGLKKDECRVEVKDGSLVISGETEETRRDGELLRHELPCGEFYRAFTVPEEIKSGEVKAAYRDGLLEIRLPKVEAGKARRVEIQ